MGNILSGRVRRDLPSVMEVSTTPVGTWRCPEAASTESSCRSPIKVIATPCVTSRDCPLTWLFSGILTKPMCVCCRWSTQWVAAWNHGINPSIQPACFCWRLTPYCVWHHHTLIWLLRKNTTCSSVLNFCPNNLLWQLRSPKSDFKGPTPPKLEELYQCTFMVYCSWKV